MNLTTVIWNESNLCTAIEDFVYDVCFEQVGEQQFKQSLSTLYEAFQHFYSAQLHYAESIQYFIQCKYWIDHFLNGQLASYILNFNRFINIGKELRLPPLIIQLCYQFFFQ